MRLTVDAIKELSLQWTPRNIELEVAVLENLKSYDVWRFCKKLGMNPPVKRLSSRYYIGWLLYHGYVRW